MPTGRVAAFSDGIFAFAATLLILNLSVVQGSALGPQLTAIWPSYVAYAVSFVTIGIIWVNHHTVMHQIGQVDRLFLLLNVLFLMFIAFIPFPTRLLAQSIDRPSQADAEAAALLYGITLTSTAVLMNALWRYASVGRRLLRRDAEARTVRGIDRSYIVGPFIYLAATLIALRSAQASAAVYALIALFYVVEASLFGR